METLDEIINRAREAYESDTTRKKNTEDTGAEFELMEKYQRKTIDDTEER